MHLKIETYSTHFQFLMDSSNVLDKYNMFIDCQIPASRVKFEGKFVYILNTC